MDECNKKENDIKWFDCSEVLINTGEQVSLELIVSNAFLIVDKTKQWISGFRTAIVEIYGVNLMGRQ